jgi:hypothetical protein
MAGVKSEKETTLNSNTSMQPLAIEFFDVLPSLQPLSANESQLSLSLYFYLSLSHSLSLKRYEDLIIYLSFIMVSTPIN